MGTQATAGVRSVKVGVHRRIRRLLGGVFGVEQRDPRFGKVILYDPRSGRSHGHDNGHCNRHKTHRGQAHQKSIDET